MDESGSYYSVADAIHEGQVEALAKILHESGREAVEKRLVYRDELPVKPFCEWKDLPEPAREGRRSMARFLLRFRIELCDFFRP